MKIGIGSDHRGYATKCILEKLLSRSGHAVADFGGEADLSSDFPDVAFVVAMAVGRGRCDCGILLDSSGMGMCLTANKIHGVRACVAYDEVAAYTARERFHCNIICLPVDLMGHGDMERAAVRFLDAIPGEGRPARNHQKITEIEHSLQQQYAEGRELPDWYHRLPERLKDRRLSLQLTAAELTLRPSA